MTTPDTASAPDVLARTLPATSATSDMPGEATTTEVKAPPLSDVTTAKPAEPVIEPAKVEADKGDGKGTETPPADVKPEGDKKPKDGINKRFSELTAERKAAEEKAATEEVARKAAEDRADALEKTLKEATEAIKQVTTKAEPEDLRPQRADFDDPNKYDAALESWAARGATKIAKAEAEQDFAKRTEDANKKAAEDAQKAETDRISKEWMERSDKFKETAADFEDVIKNPEAQITPVMAQAMLYSENGPKIAYHLGKNPAEAAKIAALPSALQLMALGRLEAALNAPPKTTTTPEPITPLKSGANSANEKTIHEMDMDAYAAKRQADLRPRKSG